MKPTRFLQSATGVSERMAGFAAHLRANGYTAGVRESAHLLRSLRALEIANRDSLRLASKALFASNEDQFKRFDDVFDAYWFNQGYERGALAQARENSDFTSQHSFAPGAQEVKADCVDGTSDQVDSGCDEEEAAQRIDDGKLVGSRVRNLSKVDLREFMTPESLQEAEVIAKRLASAMVNRLSRRRQQASRGALLDMRRILRDCLRYGGEPLHLFKRKRPERPVHIVALLDVSGSMLVYSRVFLAFVKGLVSHDTKTTAYLFHTSLVCISDDLRDRHTLRAINSLSVKAQGFGGGTRIAGNLEQFNRQYAAKSVTGRSVVIILSDGYDTDPPSSLSKAMARLKKRGCKIIWLNPLKGWKDYAPVAQGMAAALPHIDVFVAANTLDSLAALEPHLAQI